jgi:serine/threonine protein kinase
VYQREIQKSPADIYSIGVLIDTLLRGKGSYITSDPQDEHKINPNILKTSISVRPERYKDILVCIWKEVVLPILEKHFGYIKGDASNKNIEISRLLQLMMGRFLYGGFEVLITDLLKKAPPKDPDLLLKVQSMKEGSVIWSSILKIKTDVFKIQEQAATIVGKCLRCDPESRISTPDLANNLSELQGRILDLKREAIEILRLGDEK